MRRAPSASLQHGISPRATQLLLQVAKGYAVVEQRSFVTPDDVRAVAVAVLAHRVGGASAPGDPAARAAVGDLLTTVAVPDI